MMQMFVRSNVCVIQLNDVWSIVESQLRKALVTNFLALHMVTVH